MIDYFSLRLLAAFEFAAVAHKNQERKNPGHIPYISHPTSVGLILARAGFEEDVIIAGLLHDIIEDTTFTASDIIAAFGKEVCAIVLGVTEDNTLTRDERKEKYIKDLSLASLESKIVSAADLLANRTSLLLEFEAGRNPWVSFSKNHEQYAKKVLTLDKARLDVIKKDFQHPLIDELERACNKVVVLTHGIYKF